MTSEQIAKKYLDNRIKFSGLLPAQRELIKRTLKEATAEAYKEGFTAGRQDIQPTTQNLFK